MRDAQEDKNQPDWVSSEGVQADTGRTTTSSNGGGGGHIRIVVWDPDGLEHKLLGDYGRQFWATRNVFSVGSSVFSGQGKRKSSLGGGKRKGYYPLM